MTNQEKKETMPENNEELIREDGSDLTEDFKDEQNLKASEQTEIEKLKEELKKHEDKYLRVLADYQNLQKRTAQEKQDLYKYAAQKTIEALMPALDTLDYARAHLNADSNVEKIIGDFNLVFETLLKSFKDIGLEPIDEVGVPFDPFFHEPLQQIHTNELPDHTIMKILKKGYTLNKKVIRPALVVVSVRQDKSQQVQTETKSELDEENEENKELGTG